MPIICAGDIVGCVASVTDAGGMGKDRPDIEVEQKLILTAENPAFPPMVFVGEELSGIRILGRAVAFQSKVR